MFGVGKHKTRDGQDVEIVAVVKSVAIGYFIEEESDVVDVNTWSEKTGQFYIGSVDESGFDLIDPNAKKPIKKDVWVNVYPHEQYGFVVSGGYETKQDAKNHKCQSCVATFKVTIDCMEGDGLD